MQQEMIRLHKGESDALSIVVKRVFAPVLTMYQAMVREGIESGELIRADWMQIHLATLGANVFYFLSAPVWRLLQQPEPFSPDALGCAQNRSCGVPGAGHFHRPAARAELAARVLADTPMPEVNIDRLHVREEQMNARNRVFMILGLLTLGSLIWYLLYRSRSQRSQADRHRRRQ